MRGISSSQNQALSFLLNGGGLIVCIDGKFSYSGVSPNKPAVQNNGNTLLLRNVFISGYTIAINSTQSVVSSIGSEYFYSSSSQGFQNLFNDSGIGDDRKTLKLKIK